MMKVLIVDDHLMLTDALTTMLDGVEHIEVVGVASSAQDAFKVLENKQVDLVVLDIMLGSDKMNGLEAAKYMYEEFPSTKILVLTMVKKGRVIDQMLKLHVAGYVLKHTAGDELIRAITAIKEGKTYFCREVMEIHINYMREAHTEGTSLHLTRREKEIIQLLVEGFSTSQIGDQLSIGSAGVETHRKNLRRKLNVSNTAALIREAILKDLVDIDKFK